MPAELVFCDYCRLELNSLASVVWRHWHLWNYLLWKQNRNFSFYTSYTREHLIDLIEAQKEINRDNTVTVHGETRVRRHSVRVVGTSSVTWIHMYLGHWNKFSFHSDRSLTTAHVVMADARHWWRRNDVVQPTSDVIFCHIRCRRLRISRFRRNLRCCNINKCRFAPLRRKLL